jgi:serine/threonine protein kinase
LHARGQGVRDEDYGEEGKVLLDATSCVQQRHRSSNASPFPPHNRPSLHQLILKEKKEKFAKMERDILNLLSHHNIVGMSWCFQDEHSLFFVLDYCSGGELFQQVWPAFASLDFLSLALSPATS